MNQQCICSSFILPPSSFRGRHDLLPSRGANRGRRRDPDRPGRGLLPAKPPRGPRRRSSRLLRRLHPARPLRRRNRRFRPPQLSGKERPQTPQRDGAHHPVRRGRRPHGDGRRRRRGGVAPPPRPHAVRRRLRRGDDPRRPGGPRPRGRRQPGRRPGSDRPEEVGRARHPGDPADVDAQPRPEHDGVPRFHPARRARPQQHDQPDRPRRPAGAGRGVPGRPARPGRPVPDRRRRRQDQPHHDVPASAVFAAVAPERRPGEGEPAVRPRPRRPGAGRGRRRRGAGGAGGTPAVAAPGSMRRCWVSAPRSTAA